MFTATLYSKIRFCVVVCVLGGVVDSSHPSRSNAAFFIDSEKKTSATSSTHTHTREWKHACAMSILRYYNSHPLSLSQCATSLLAMEMDSTTNHRNTLVIHKVNSVLVVL
ncbi:Hypothetical protein, putative [Bodo saltans]|uniref:Secreted protein n=1 Tax=Bodo saltans TaxID=75058 RepID=A0A0S4JLN8_BODSA|nr:Hypothetical protein, putative [Bodo saltans]|eukprot:CUG91127.1 Hypothetical protein, putative [Bodo saltans]